MFVLVGSINRSGLLQLSFDKLFVCFWVVVLGGGGARQAGFVTSCCPRCFCFFAVCVVCILQITETRA